MAQTDTTGQNHASKVNTKRIRDNAARALELVRQGCLGMTAEERLRYYEDVLTRVTAFMQEAARDFAGHIGTPHKAAPSDRAYQSEYMVKKRK